VEEDKAAALECKAEYERLQALAGPLFSMRRARNPEHATGDDLVDSLEDAWGKAKLEFGRKLDAENPKKLEENMLKALSTETILTLTRIRRFARRTRD
ncbi:unnamed protein product, partial [Ectocarpus sp. 12 AP-2014]